MKKIVSIVLLLPFGVMAQTTNQNYIKTTTYKDSTATASVVQMTYFDGLGRPVQQIANGQSNSGKNIVTHMEYDTYGRQVKEFLPYAGTTSSPDYITNALSETGTFYNTATYENTANPYSEKQLEASPLNRVLKQAAPGASWALGSGHEIRMDYQTNVATGINSVKNFKVTTTWNSGNLSYDIQISSPGNYAAGTLYCTITKDEDWTSGDNNTTQEFKDKEGRVVLKRTFNNTGVRGATEAYSTYYVYDDYGNLTYVIPPLAGSNYTNLDGLCYQYKYDERNRMVAKKLPGKQWEFIVYDKLDRPVATGPVFSPFGDSTVGMAITEYDIFGRVTQTGWKAMTVTEADRGTRQGNINSGSNPFALSTNDILNINYYDNYSFPGAPTLPSTVEGQLVATAVKGLATGTWLRLMTSPTALYGATSYTLYDKKYRPIRSHAGNPMGGYTRIDTKLDFIGKTLYTKTFHKRVSADAEIIITDNFTYSAQDRLVLHTHQIGSGTVQLIAKNTYNELGQLISKNVGGTDATGALGLQKVDYAYNIRGWLKGINDITSLNEGTSPQDLFAFKIGYNNHTNIGTNDVSPPALLYNGNISETYWMTNSDNSLRKYTYEYDKLNRLNNSYYLKPNAPSSAYSYDENVAYDKNGNISLLIRNGTLDSDGTVPAILMDELTYTYNTDNPNRLKGVEDSSGNDNGFKDVASANNLDYGYDANGNMTSDANKGITSIVYNHLNLPTKISFGSGSRIEYLYNATGVKLQKTVTQGSTVTTTLYFDGFQYVDNVLQFFPHAEGYVKSNTGGTYQYVFNYTDHLGNVRVSYSDIDKNGTLGNEYVQICSPGGKAGQVCTGSYLSPILEESHYYPFGLKHDGYNTAANQPSYNYKFNGKELQDELGLNMYDYGARNYDAAIGRWMNIDPLSEVSRRYNPYTYALDNPVVFVDLDGMKAESSQTANIYYDWDEGGYRTQEGKESTEDKALSQFSGGDPKKGGLEEIVTIRGKKYHKNTTNLFAKVGNAINGFFGGDSDYFVEHKPYDPVEEHMLNETITTGVGFIGGGYIAKGVGKIGGALLSKIVTGPGMTTVGRWMSLVEYETMQATGTMVEGAGGQTFVSTGGPNAFTAAARGSVYAEFQVPTNSLLKGGVQGWFKTIGPSAGNAMKSQLAKQGGQLMPTIQKLSPILQIK